MFGLNPRSEKYNLPAPIFRAFNQKLSKGCCWAWPPPFHSADPSPKSHRVPDFGARGQAGTHLWGLRGPHNFGVPGGCCGAGGTRCQPGSDQGQPRHSHPQRPAPLLMTADETPKPSLVPTAWGGAQPRDSSSPGGRGGAVGELKVALVTRRGHLWCSPVLPWGIVLAWRGVARHGTVPTVLSGVRGGSGCPPAPPVLVPCQQCHAGEGPGAGTAPVPLGAQMGPQVGAEVGAVSEGSATVGTGVGLLPWGGGKDTCLGTPIPPQIPLRSPRALHGDAGGVPATRELCAQGETEAGGWKKGGWMKQRAPGGGHPYLCGCGGGPEAARAGRRLCHRGCRRRAGCGCGCAASGPPGCRTPWRSAHS